jgi:hypothetical protein
MKRPVRVLLMLFGIFLVSAPFSVVATILLLPLWSWVEASFGIESVGHSGPAEWCYAVIYLLFVAIGAPALLGRERAKQGGAKVA